MPAEPWIVRAETANDVLRQVSQGVEDLGLDNDIAVENDADGPFPVDLRQLWDGG